MKKIVVFVCLLCSFGMIFAQNGSIAGSVVDAEKQSPLAFAGVALLRPSDSTLLRSEMTDKSGRFTIPNLSPGRYLVKVYYFGCRDFVSEPIIIGKTCTDLGTIVLQTDAQMLQSVEVVYKKPLFEQKLGKTVMNVESQPSAAGDNVLELLRKMPGVMVDNSDNISLQGKSGVLILIDDKDPHLSGDDLTNYLKSMPATMIDRVEVMKNPSARYDAAGTSGIINLVTKHDRINGINGSVWAGVDYNGNVGTNDGFNLTARVGKWVLSGSYYYMFNKSKAGSDSETISFINGDTLRQASNERPEEIWNSLSKFQSHGFNFSADYNIDSVNTLSFSYRGNIFDMNWDSHTYNRLYLNNELFSAFSNESSSLGKHGNHQINANFKHIFDTLGTTLYLDATYSLDHNRGSSLREMPYYMDDFQTLFRRDRYWTPDLPNRMHVAALKLDIEMPINDKISMEYGVKTSYARNDNNSVNYLNDSLLESKSSHFVYEESITAAYVQANFQLSDRLTAQTGLRGEFTHLKGNLLTTQEVNQQNYFDVFPSLQFDYQLPKMNNLSFAFRSRISRPGYYSLNPHIDIEDEYNYSTGNPYLEPEYMHTVAVDYSWHYMLFATVAYEFTRGTEETMVYTDKLTNIRLSKPENIGKMHAMRVSAFATIPVGRWWMMMWNVNYVLGKQMFDYETQKVASLKSNLQFYTMHTFSFLKHYSVELGVWWMPKQKNTFGTTKSVVFAWAGFKASFLKDALTIRLSVRDIFNQSTWVSHDIYPDGSIINQRWMSKRRSVDLNISYRFGKQNIQVRQRRSGDNDEFNRMGGGDSGQGNQGGMGK